jgi:2-polyprenyl-3-methyl-5-hydroxy-6-metoxy-1,4-benzoquinol methylase
MATAIDTQVLEFYKNLPFNIHSSPSEQIHAIRQRNSVLNYPVLPPLLKPGTSVLEVGCGTGWLSNSISHYYQANVTGIDFNPKAIAFCQQVAQAMSLATQFSVEDLFAYKPANKFDVVVSLGVLHHTPDCHRAVRRICADFVAPGGTVFIGLYHHYGRKPFLDHFKAMQENGADETQMLARYKQIHAYIKDDTHLLSWFRDQVLHPHETQHTLAEMLPILEETGLELVSTSLNHFQALGELASILEDEKRFYDIGMQRLQENKYFPGFFLFLARKK